MAQLDGISSSTPEVKQLDLSEKNIQSTPSVQSQDSFMTRSSYDADLLDAFAGMDENCLLGEAAIVKETKKPDTIVEPPALPQRSSLRASRMLDTLRLSSIESATQSLTTPHDAYMSSEEDASSSADEFSDYDYDSSSETSEGSPMRRKSYEDTARLVSVVYSGKPSLVNLPSPRRSTISSTPDSCSEIESPIETESNKPVSSESHPPRTSSLVPAHQPSFLTKDPFAETNYTLDNAKEVLLDAAPRTAVKSQAVLNRVQRTFSLARKRSRTFLPGALMSKEDLSIPPLPISTINLARIVTTPVEETKEEGSPTESVRTPVRYSDIIRSAKRHASSHSISTIASPITPLTPGTPSSPFASRKGLLSGLKSGHRRSLKP
ncbi:hypothetical protein PFICI_07859 [Pestalotiopsis fici W106-1]|uniref:Uncharacterized protein n=1 Tax=Pestalotiopsis fici (strain W106-1 / CGMCC3.15140) TaxID=1229662 RepID=W3X2P3_PESFW|nr:uncharacterized protein PFICI_07859 [Pestalotiopsis fici W106-1]ETS80330.1 hypothetical protein PFICI_07859 [Pestalotiopsis fici W106-1]